jgi:hypothetical protein
VKRDSPIQLSVYFPATAGVDDAYAKTFGVNIVLHPQSETENNRKQSQLSEPVLKRP